MTDNQYYSHIWLSRMWDADVEINQLIIRRDKILASMSGIGKYDGEYIPVQNGENPTESKNIEFSLVCDQIEKKLHKLSCENVRTHQVINKLDDTMLRGMLEARYINRLSWEAVGKLYNYERTRARFYGRQALENIYPFIPKEEEIK